MLAFNCVWSMCVYVVITIYDTHSRGCLMLAFNCVWSMCVCVCSYNNLRHTFPWLSDAGIQLCVVCVCCVLITIYNTHSCGCLILAFNCVWSVCVCICSYNNLRHTFPWLSDAGIQLCVVHVCICIYNNLRHTFPWLSDAGIQLCVVHVCICSYNNL